MNMSKEIGRCAKCRRMGVLWKSYTGSGVYCKACSMKEYVGE
tara:strand:+ start:12148 stop:12273 length:126 start_codon:yes stop_codon:yes gene_type:complete